MGFRVLVGDPISGGVHASVPIIPRTVNVTYAGGMSNDTAVFPVALLENAVTRRLHIKAKKCAVHLSDEPMRCPFPMNCLCSTCGLTLIPGGWWETLSLSDCGRVARQSGLVFFKIEFNGLEFGIRTESGH